MTNKKVIVSGTTVESVAKVAVINPKSQVLVLTIGEYIARPERSYTPDLPGGMVEEGESELTAVMRETEEETGIVLARQDLTLGYSKTEFFSSEKKSVSKFLYVVYLDHIPEVTVSWEHASSEWVPVETLLAVKKFRPFYEEAIKYCLSHEIIC